MLVVSNRLVEYAQWFSSPEQLKRYLKTKPEIKTILFAFWSWRVDKEMLSEYKCYGLHTGFLLDGKGAGGSPIDNLKLLGIDWAALNVFEMTEIIDGGHVRLAIPVPLTGSKEEVVHRISRAIPAIIKFLNQDINKVPERFKRLNA